MGDSSHPFRPELRVCILLIFGVIGSWTSFLLFLNHSAGERAAFWFMRKHLSLGEPTEFVLQIAGQGIPQPVEILITWREFQLSLLWALTLIAGLVWLAYRVWNAGMTRSA